MPNRIVAVKVSDPLSFGAGTTKLKSSEMLST